MVTLLFLVCSIVRKERERRYGIKEETKSLREQLFEQKVRVAMSPHTMMMKDLVSLTSRFVYTFSIAAMYSDTFISDLYAYSDVYSGKG